MTSPISKSNALLVCVLAVGGFARTTLAMQSTLTVELVVDEADGLRNPVSIVSIPEDDRLFLVELDGEVRVLRDGALEPGAFLDAAPFIDAGPLTGLRTIAFHPGFETNGFVYLWCDAPGMSGTEVDIVLARMTRSASDPDHVDPASWIELLREPQEFIGHGGGHLAFGPDGMLYAGFGDGGVQGDPACNAQDGSSLMGTILRLDVDSGLPYQIPADNPFVGDPAVRDEVWHRGLRHPYKWSFDPVTGDMWIPDIGQSTREEINFVPAGVGGLNFGWKVMEGTHCFGTSGCLPGLPPCGDPAYTLPIHEYDHGPGCAITGGFVYRGSDVPDLVGAYLFADLCTTRLWTVREQGGQAIELTDRGTELQPGGALAITAPIAFGYSGRGEPYVIDYHGKELYRVIRRDSVSSFCPGSVNATGVPGELAVVGSTSLGQNTLKLVGESLPPGSTGLFIYGPRIARYALGGGTLCISVTQGAPYRFGLTQADQMGKIVYDLDMTLAPFARGPGHIEAGSTWAFQFWHRDFIPAGFNFTGALSLRFDP